MLRINMAALWVVMCVGVLIERLVNKKPGDLIRFIVLFSVGAAAVLLPILFWLYKNDALPSFIKDYFEFNIIYSHSSIKEKFSSMLTFSTGALSATAIPILTYVCFAEKKRADWLCLISFCFTLLMITISGRNYPHYGLVLVPLYAYSVARLLFLLDRLKTHVSSNQYKAIVLTTVVFFGILFSETIIQWGSSVIHNDIVYANNENTKIVGVIQKHTDINDKITVCGNRDIVYLLSDRESSSRYSYQTVAHESETIKEEYLSDLRRLDTTMIIVTKNGFLYDEILDVTADYYDLVETVNNTEIYLLRDISMLPQGTGF